MPLLVIAIGVGIFALAHTAPFPFLLDGSGRGDRSGTSRAPGVPAIYLTYDDGPNPAATPALLDVLRAGRRDGDVLPDSEAHHRRDRADRAADARRGTRGRAALAHTRADAASPAALARQLAADAERIGASRAARRVPSSARTPAGAAVRCTRGSTAPATSWPAGASRCGTGTGGDRRRPEKLASRLAGRASDGDIVVMHDGHHENPRADRARTVKATAS